MNRALRPEHCSSRSGKEAELDEQRQHRRFRDRLAVEALDGESAHPSGFHLTNESFERDAQPVVIGIPQRHE